jgi:hypothetical protein
MSQYTQERVSLGAYVDRELREQLAERARLEDRSVSSLVRSALAAYMGAGTERQTMILDFPRTHGRASEQHIETLEAS